MYCYTKYSKVHIHFLVYYSFYLSSIFSYSIYSFFIFILFFFFIIFIFFLLIFLYFLFSISLYIFFEYPLPESCSASFIFSKLLRLILCSTLDTLLFSSAYFLSLKLLLLIVIHLSLLS